MLLDSEVHSRNRKAVKRPDCTEEHFCTLMSEDSTIQEKSDIIRDYKLSDSQIHILLPEYNTSPFNSKIVDKLMWHQDLNDIVITNIINDNKSNILKIIEQQVLTEYMLYCLADLILDNNKKDKYPLDPLSRSQRLTEKFMNDHREYLDFNTLSIYQTLSDIFIISNIDRFKYKDLRMLIIFQSHLSDRCKSLIEGFIAEYVKYQISNTLNDEEFCNRLKRDLELITNNRVTVETVFSYNKDLRGKLPQLISAPFFKYLTRTNSLDTEMRWKYLLSKVSNPSFVIDVWLALNTK